MKRLFRVLFAAASVICAACMVLLFSYFRMNQESADEYENLLTRVVTVRETAEQSEIKRDQNTEKVQQAGMMKNPPSLFVDFDELRKVNEDIAAWIDFPGQNISYPVVQGSDNTHYLKYTFEGKRNAAGCIFVDSRNEGLLTDNNTIIYGHNMRNGSMFGLLKQYMEKDHYEQFPYFDLYLPDGVFRCRILACCRVPAKEENYPTRFVSDLERSQFVSGMRKKGTYSIDPSDSKEDMPLGGLDNAFSEKSTDGELPLVMLSTCIGGQSKYRFVILAEAVKVETELLFR